MLDYIMYRVQTANVLRVTLAISNFTLLHLFVQLFYAMLARPTRILACILQTNHEICKQTK